MEDEIRSKGLIIRNNTFQIGTQKVFLNSGEVHYFRIPPEEWEDRLTKAKTLGLNAISTYICWNYHEKEAGKFDITSRHKDLDHFLHLCENKGLYVIIRPGPWIGADVVNGGIPNWVFKDHPKIMIQNENFEVLQNVSKKSPPISYLSPTYLRIVEKYFDRLSEVLRRHLYPHGGLILLQIDNSLSFQSNPGLYEVDYNPVALEFYKKFLKEKYREIEVVNKFYSQNFLSFDHIEPPTSKTQEDAINSQNEFKSAGELLRIINWMEFKERILQEYIASISYILRKKEIYLPYFVNVPFLGSPVNPKQMYSSYKTKILVGLSIDDRFTKIQESSSLLESCIEILKTQIPLLTLIPELKIGNAINQLSVKQIYILIRLVLGHGIQGMNYYMGVGGVTPQSYSILEKSIGHDENSFTTDETGNSYDYGAPIGMLGQKNPNYEAITLISKYIQLNQKNLLGAKKVYDEEIAMLHFHPYSRLIFNTTKFGFATDYHQLHGTDSHPEFSLFSKLGFHPRWIDLEKVTNEKLSQHKIVIIRFSEFLDQNCMDSIRQFVEGGGILISFFDIPKRDKNMVIVKTLTDLYKAEIHKKENPKSIHVKELKLTALGDVYSYRLLESIENSSDFYINDVVASDDPSKPSKVYGFHRSVQNGHIYHFGFNPTVNEHGAQFFESFLLSLGVSSRKSIHDKNLTVLRLRTKDEEEFVTVANLSDQRLENTQVVLNDVMSQDGQSTIDLNELTIVENSATQWSVNKKINENAYVKVCTSELNDIRKRVKKDVNQFTVSGFHFKGSRNILEVNLKYKPEKVISGKKDITNRIFKPDNKLRVQFKEIKVGKEKLYKISAVYSDDLQLSLHFKGKEKAEVLDFNIKRKNTFIDQVS